MAYRSVFYALQEVFPQVDPRILKEIAIKYSSDADAAVEYVLSDVLPVITDTEPTEKYFPLPPDCGFQGKDVSLGHQTRQNLYPKIENYNPNPTFDDVPSSSYATSSPPLMKKPYMEKNKQVVEEASSSQFVPNYLNPQENPFYSNIPFNPLNYDATKDLIQLEDYSNLHYQPLNARVSENTEGNLMDSVISEIFENEERKLEKLNGEISVKMREEKEPLLPKENENEIKFENSNIQKISEGNKFEHSDEKELDKNTPFESLDELISDMAKNKEILSSALESTIIKMKEVEIEEENAKLAKEEIIETDKKTKSMVENIDQMIKSTKETNYEHAGEVKREKSMLENESKELYCKLVNLSAQKDEYISAIDEINNTLDARLKVAGEEKERAEKEIAEKEGVYLEICKEKEIILEEINRESVRLEKEAEENIMLKDFLLECARKVDILQGEISDINMEVMSLKGKLNEYILLNTPMLHKPVPEIPVQEIPVPEMPVVQETPVPVVPEEPVPDNPLVPCSLASSNFLEDHESTTFDGAKSILQNDYLTIKEHEKIKLNEKEKKLPQKETSGNDEKAFSDDEWEIY